MVSAPVKKFFEPMSLSWAAGPDTGLTTPKRLFSGFRHLMAGSLVLVTHMSEYI